MGTGAELDPTSRQSQQSVAETWGQLPLSFEANHGQLDEAVRYVARGDGFNLFFGANEAVFVHDAPAKTVEVSAAPADVLRAPVEARPDGASHETEGGSVVRMQFVNATSTFEPTGVDALPGTVNYLVGNDPAAWRTKVPTFREVRYGDVWNGIDVVFHGRRQQLEYDFAIRPGVDFRQIEVALVGVDKIDIDAAGNLVLDLNGERQVHRAPRIVQDPDGASTVLSGRFVLRGENRFGFEVDNRDPALPLLIDPEVVFATPFFGGSNNDNVSSLAVGKDGRVTVAGFTQSLDFPGTSRSSFQPKNLAARPLREAGIVARLSPDGTSLDWATYLSGTGSLNQLAVGAVDNRGFAYLCGGTNSADFPTTPNAHDRVLDGPQDAFLSVLTPDGSNLSYSSLFGGDSFEFFFGCTLLTKPSVPRRTLIAATGYTQSPEFPTVNAPPSTITTGLESDADAVVTVVDPKGPGGGIVYSSLLPGGSDFERGDDIDAFADTLAISGFTVSAPRPPVVAWHHATEDGRGVALMSSSGPSWVFPPGYGNSWIQLLTKAFTLPASPVTVTFSARWETEEAFDFLRLRISTDGGATWTVLDELDGFSNGFEERVVDLSPFAGKQMLLQFQFTSDALGSDEDGFIDTNGSAVDWIAVTGSAIDAFETGLDGWLAEDGYKAFPSAVSHGPLGNRDAFVAIVKPFKSPATIPVAAVGGTEFDESNHVEFAPDRAVVVAGRSNSATFPVTDGAYQENLGTNTGNTNLWVGRFSPDLSVLHQATFLGGNNFEFLNGLAVDRHGQVILTGITESTDYPLVDPISLAPLLGSGGGRDYIFSILSADLSELVHSSRFGNAGWELGGEVVLDPLGFIYFVGRERTGGAESGATTDVFVVKLSP